jgi:Cdc6-like AAA superfamily ATPase
MDAARTTRKYPSYTTAQLETFVADGVTEFRSAEKVADIAVEVAARKSGASVHRPTPQTKGGITIPRLGRM